MTHENIFVIMDCVGGPHYIRVDRSLVPPLVIGMLDLKTEIFFDGIPYLDIDDVSDYHNFEDIAGRADQAQLDLLERIRAFNMKWNAEWKLDHDKACLEIPRALSWRMWNEKLAELVEWGQHCWERETDGMTWWEK